MKEQRQGDDGSLGQSLARARRKLGKTQQEVGDALGIKQPRVSHIEAADDNLTVATLRAYVEALGGELVITADFGKTQIRIGVGDEQPATKIREER